MTPYSTNAAGKRQLRRERGLELVGGCSARWGARRAQNPRTVDRIVCGDGGGDFLDRLRGRVRAADVLATHQLVRGVDLVATVLQRCVAAVGPAFLADLRRALGRDREAEKLAAVLVQLAGKLVALEVLGDQPDGWPP